MSNIVQPARMEPTDRCEQIVRVAGAHFAERGFAKASMAGIAADAGVTRALVYHYFPDKTALFEAVLHSEADALLAATRLDADLSPRDNIRRAIHAYLTHFSPPSSQVVNLHTQADAQPALVGQITQANHAILAQRIVTLLALGDNPLIHAAVGAWLEFVTALSRDIAKTPEIDRASVVDLCMCTLEAVTGAPLLDAHHAPVSRSARKRRP